MFMNKSSQITLGLFLFSFIGARLAAAGVIPTTIQTSSQAATTSPTSSAALPLPTSEISAVAQHQSHTGNIYALDPFGILQSTQQGGQVTGSDHQEGKQTSESKATGSTSNGAIAMASKSASDPSSPTTAVHSGTETKSESLSSARQGTSAVQSTPTQPNSSQSVPAGTAPPRVIPTAGPGGDSSSGSSMNSWKIIGIGVLSVAGVALLVIGTAFHDAIFRVLARPFRRRKEDEEVLVPDWHRGSWRFGDDGYGLEKSSEIHQNEGGPRIPEGEKGNLTVPLPPVSPFPLRRAPSTSTRSTRLTEPGLAGIGAGGTGAVKSQGSSYSILPSPPGLRTPQETSKSKRKSVCSSSASGHDGHESDAYGGIE